MHHEEFEMEVVFEEIPFEFLGITVGLISGRALLSEDGTGFAVTAINIQDHDTDKESGWTREDQVEKKNTQIAFKVFDLIIKKLQGDYNVMLEFAEKRLEHYRTKGWP